ncbi:UNVERIFIED_ORG: N-acetylglucosaminyl-diphospho-decaprenol L-rhamnosyltransferase [Arthrobacter sp. UYCu721]
MSRTFPQGIDVVVVSYNSASYIPRLAYSLRLISIIATVTVVDNGSLDGSAELAEAADWGAELTVLRSPSNPGFGASMNLGAFRGQNNPHDQILILNPDVDISERTLLALSRNLANRSDLATIGPVLETPGGRAVSSARHFPTFRSMALRQIQNADHHNELTDVDWICGASMLWRRAAFEQLKGFSDDYFLYFEDVDICKRASTGGWRVAIAGSVRAVHDQGHGRKTAPNLKRESRISRRKYARRWLGVRGYLASGIADASDWAADIYHAKRGQ